MDFQRCGRAKLYQALLTVRQVVVSLGEMYCKMLSVMRVLSKAVDIGF